MKHSNDKLHRVQCLNDYWLRVWILSHLNLLKTLHYSKLAGFPPFDLVFFQKIQAYLIMWFYTIINLVSITLRVLSLSSKTSLEKKFMQF